MFSNWFGPVGARYTLVLTVVSLVCLAGSSATGQATSASIIGRVTDSSGSILPGVTVTATSPALQVPQVTTVTNEIGEYRLAPLPIGLYELTFELSGFDTARRSEIRLTVGFTARVNQLLGVGALSETVTVSAQAPIVDVASSAGATLITRDVLDLNATSRTGAMSVLEVTPGVRSFIDVGGSQIAENPSARSFGQADEVWYTLDGVAMVEDGRTFWDYNTLEEVKVQTLGTDAEYPTRGVQMEGIVKSGGNQFHGRAGTVNSSPKLQGNNIDQELEAIGISSGNTLSKQYDVTFDVGGRVVRDKLWFYGAFRRREQELNVLNAFKPDGSPQTYNARGMYTTAKVSWQVTPANKLIFFDSTDNSYENKGGDELVAWEARETKDILHPTAKVEWEGVRGDSLISNLFIGYNKHDSMVPFVSTNVGRSDLETEVFTGENVVSGEHSLRETFHYRGSTTLYKPNSFKGNHEFKAGFDYLKDERKSGFTRRPRYNYHLIYNDGNPFEVAFFNFPVQPDQSNRSTWLYARDRWTIGSRLTLNLGLRFERDAQFVPDACRDAADYPSDITFPAECFPKVEINTYNALAPRLHFAYDFSGSGRTVLKGGYGRYNQQQRAAGQYDRIATTYGVYSWNDLNGNNDWDPNETNRDPNGSDFVEFTGNEFDSVGSRVIVNPDLKQQTYDEYSVTLEHQFASNLSVRGSGIYSKANNIQRLLNTFRPPEAYNIPVTNQDPGPDGRLGTADDGGPFTYYEFSPDLAGAQFEEFMWVNDPRADQTYKSLELAFTKRLSSRWQLNASYSATKKNIPIGARGSATNPGIMDLATIGEFNPNTEIFTADHTWDWDGKASGAYQFPFGVTTSVNYTHRSGDAYSRQVQFRGGQTIPSIVLPVEEIGSQRLPNINLTSVKIEKAFPFGTQRLQVGFSVYNALNANTADREQQRAGSSFLRPRRILPPRIAEFGLTYTF
jgi:Carboxypeptidase regulatory-like domain/TonB dependent receptor-like, beta-barrel